MARRLPKLFPLAALLGLGALLALGSGRSLRAQGHTPDPYNGVGEGNIGYRDYLVPSVPNGYGITPGQGILSGRVGASRSNQFQNYLEDLDNPTRGGEPHDVPSGNAGPGVPYYRAYRRYDQRFNRVYTPNQTADKGYFESRESRDDKYFQMMNEKDPKRRSELNKEYQQDRLRASRDLSLSPRGGGARAGTASAPPPPSSRVAPAPPESPAPPPTGGTSNRNARSAVPPPGTYANNPSSLLNPSPPPPPASRAAPRTGSSTPPPPLGSGRLSPSEILRRNERMDRANRSRTGTATPPRRP